MASYIQAPLQERKVYIACMHVSSISITLSFLPAELQRHDALSAGDVTGDILVSCCVCVVFHVMYTVHFLLAYRKDLKKLHLSCKRSR